MEKLKNKIRFGVYAMRAAGKPKIFGIGNNKTGTTSLKRAMGDLGYIVGHQQTAENLISQWAKRDFREIVRYCKTAQFFQDSPFSHPYTYILMDHEFPNSKFILTVRDSPEQWYNSLTKFHAKRYGKNNRIPTKEDLENAPRHYKGSIWAINRWKYNTPEDDPYNKEELIKTYIDHNEQVIEYFRHRPDDLLVLNVAEKNAFKKLCDFLGKSHPDVDFPWENKTADIITKS